MVEQRNVFAGWKMRSEHNEAVALVARHRVNYEEAIASREEHYSSSTAYLQSVDDILASIDPMLQHVLGTQSRP